MIRYRYFIRRAYGHGIGIAYHCVRDHETDPRIPDLVKQYNNGWNYLIQYPYEPSRDEESFNIKGKFSHNIYGDVLIVDDPDKMPQLR